MMLYVDTSALIKRYVEEDGSDRVNALWNGATGIATSVVAFAEMIAALNRKRREGVLSAAEYTRTATAFKNDYRRVILVPVSAGLNERIETLARKHALRGFDAIHLASALVIRNSGKVETGFACCDRMLNEAAGKEGFQAIL
jgi:predicted nucleic acid-binding protein